MATHRVLDLLPGREADPPAAWLKAHPGVRVICRDRAGAYAEAATRAAPGTPQVADRWHLLHNLGQHAEKDIARHRGCLQRATRTDSGSAVDAAGIEDLPAQALSAQGALESRTRRRHRDTHTLLEQGWALAEIARELHLNHKTVQTFARATRVEDLLGHIAGHLPSKLDAQRDYLLRRWAEGCHSPTALHRELADRGLHCNVRPITRYLRTVQVNGNLPAPGPAPPKTRRLVGWIMRHPTSLEPGEQELLMRPPCLCRGRSTTWVASSLLGHPHRDATVPGATSMGIGHGAVRESGVGPACPAVTDGGISGNVVLFGGTSVAELKEVSRRLPVTAE